MEIIIYSAIIGASFVLISGFLTNRRKYLSSIINLSKEELANRQKSLKKVVVVTCCIALLGPIPFGLIMSFINTRSLQEVFIGVMILIISLSVAICGSYWTRKNIVDTEIKRRSN